MEQTSNPQIDSKIRQAIEYLRTQSFTPEMLSEVRSLLFTPPSFTPSCIPLPGPSLALPAYPIAHSSIGMSESAYTQLKPQHSALPPFDYSFTPSFPVPEASWVKLVSSVDSVPFVYFGQVDSEEQPCGKGCMLLRPGEAREGFWLKGELHGRGQTVDRQGTSYAGEF
mmetsp:Transcript_3337/g.4120  ORF Transcript_3337/g.4120 Transcript_3337/m.4120 type:complete len:168 (-) Transcript_3337:78-581(-)